MKQPRLILIVIGVLVLGALLVLAWPSGPSYHGRSLEWWIKRHDYLENSSRVRTSREDLEKAEHAIKSMGTKAVPALVRWMQTPENAQPDSRFKSKINALLDKQRFIPFRFEEPAPYDKWSIATAGFYFLGNDAMTAIPELTRLLNSTSDLQRIFAFRSILMIASDKRVLLPIIVQSLQRKDDLRVRAAFYIHETHPEQAQALGVYEILPWMRPPATNGVSTSAISQAK